MKFYDQLLMKKFIQKIYWIPKILEMEMDDAECIQLQLEPENVSMKLKTFSSFFKSYQL